MRQQFQHDFVFFIVVLFSLTAGCQPAHPEHGPNDRLNIVATTSMIADLVSVIAGQDADVIGLMGPGVDPHLYKASEGDVARMANADAIFYNGLHLEGKMGEIFEQMHRLKPTHAVAEQSIPDSLLIESELFVGNYDPHTWFDVMRWKRVAQYTGERLAELKPEHAESFKSRTTAYLSALDSLDAYIRTALQVIPEQQRVLVTAHDAFGYFGEAYGFEVRGLQGLSTATEAGTADVQALVSFIVERRIPAMFVETSVPARSIEAVQAAVRDRGFNVEIGGYLYSDALGSPDTPEATYIGTVRSNVDTIVKALGRQAPA